jgi:CDP-6-deoxy-D-xylo-4-hexulose-3-dehydrase
VGELPNTDFVMNNVFWIGVYPGLTTEMLDFVANTILNFAAESSLNKNESREDLK